MSGYTIFKADFKKHKEDILNLLINNLEDQSLLRYEWNYEKCPFGYVPCWLAKHDKTDMIVGTAALYPRKVIVEGKEYIAAISAGFGVDKKHRVLGPAILLQKELQLGLKDSKIKFIYEAPNDLSRMIFLRIGYKKIAPYKKYIKILSTKYVSKKYILNSLGKTKYSRIMNFILNHKLTLVLIDFLIIIMSKEFRYKKRFKYYTETPEYFDKRFDIFWKEVSKEYNILGVRTSEFLNWRFKQSTLHNYEIFCISNDKKEILGYIVYYIQGNRYYIADILYFNQDNVQDSLLAEFALFARQNKIGAIIIHHLGTKLVEKLKNFNYFFFKKKDGEILLYCLNSSIEPILLDESNWHFFEGDIDV